MTQCCCGFEQGAVETENVRGVTWESCLDAVLFTKFRHQLQRSCFGTSPLNGPSGLRGSGLGKLIVNELCVSVVFALLVLSFVLLSVYLYIYINIKIYTRCSLTKDTDPKRVSGYSSAEKETFYSRDNPRQGTAGH